MGKRVDLRPARQPLNEDNRLALAQYAKMQADRLYGLAKKARSTEAMRKLTQDGRRYERLVADYRRS